ncbi:MAG TPA: pyridoxine 5'-phosphate synthase [Bacteroidia bacterium]|nr:pyridoxine 5'-phosphate synthase [Bacteroidia bacterium]
MTRLSVNINKIATLRNARGGNVPDLIKAALDIERFGAQGITVHPRPDERHITYKDVRDLKAVLQTEFNIEGNPREQKFMDLVLDVCPHQVTLVPDTQNQITSDHGWDTKNHRAYLSETIALFKSKGIRVSIFVDPEPEMVRSAVECGTDRIELYTEEYARRFAKDKDQVVQKFSATALLASQLGLKVNAGHDLNLQNLRYFKEHVMPLAEVSIGHALISDALYFGLENTVQMYLRQLK